MDWCRLSAGYYRDPAIAQAGEAAELLFVRALSYCAEQETGGIVPLAVLPVLTPTKPEQRAAALVKHRLWLREGDHFRVRSWERIQEALEAEAERRRKDRDRKAEKRRQEREAAAAKESAERPQDVRGQSADAAQDTPRTVQAENPRKEVEVEQPSVVGPRKRATPAPDLFPITDDMRAWAAREVPQVDIDRETRQFLDFHRAKGSTFKDWTAGWRTWMRKSLEFGGSRQQPQTRNPQTSWAQR